MEHKKITFNQRRAIQHGFSLFVNLPALWVHNVNLKRADKLDVIWNQEDNSLTIKRIEEKDK